jgi:hypothetical protein
MLLDASSTTRHFTLRPPKQFKGSADDGAHPAPISSTNPYLGQRTDAPPWATAHPGQGTVTIEEPGGTPHDPELGPTVPDEVWQQFLESAFREDPVAPRPRPLPRPRPFARQATAYDVPYSPEEAVGDLWQPEDRTAERPWHEMDGRARLRRVCRTLALAAAGALILGALSQLPTDTSRERRPGHSETLVRQPTPSAAPTTAHRTGRPRS